MTRDEFPEAVLTRLIARHLDTDPESLAIRRSPTGKFNDTYFVEGGPVPLILRVAPHDDRSRMLFYEHRMMRQEPGLHSLLRERTDLPVPAVLAHDFSPTEIDRDYLLMERLPGTPITHLGGLTQDAFNDLLREVGRCLRQVHEITGDRYGYVGDHRPMEPQSGWPSAFHVMWHKLLDDIEGCGGYASDEATSMRRLLDRHAEVFDRPVPASLLRRLRVTAPRPPRLPSRPPLRRSSFSLFGSRQYRSLTFDPGWWILGRRGSIGATLPHRKLQEVIFMQQPMATDLCDWSTMESMMVFVVESVPIQSVSEVAEDGRETEKMKEASRKNRRLRLSRKQG